MDSLLSWLGITLSEYSPTVQGLISILPIVLIGVLLIVAGLYIGNKDSGGKEEEENLSEMDKEIAFIRALQERRR